MSIPNIVLLLSAPYSGATLLSILMNQHPEVSSDGEIFPYDVRAENLLCTCGKKQTECDYYRTVASSMMNVDKKGWNANLFYAVPQYSRVYHLSRAFEGFWINPIAKKMRDMICSAFPKYRRLEEEFFRVHLDFFVKSLKLRGASIYFDGTKSIRRAEFFAERKLTTKMVHLIRDGRAFCYSYLKNKGLDQRYLPMAVKDWKRSIRKIDTLRRRFPRVEILVVRHNDICSATERELKRIFEFIGLSFDESLLAYRNDDMHVLGNRMRFNYSGVIKEDNSWKTNFSQYDILVLNRLMSKELRRFGFL